ncbi:MAG: UDP-N-acetylmuramate dehydrogenase [Methylococcaceae bacterium]|nr:UDP-N-acetylmuramate dehydrogenase [Methylococcaceae bacterium]
MRFNEPLENYTSWRVGGIAERFYQPADKADLIRFVQNLPENEPLFWMGLGSNLLVRDGGIRGTVINTKNRLKVMRQIDDETIYVEVGVPCALVAKFCAEQGLIGAEFLAGIPGTMGGALKMNAGAFGGETWRCVQNVEMLNRHGNIFKKFAHEFESSYRHVNLKEDEWFLASTLKLEKGDTSESQQNIKALLAKRANSQPTNQPSCGSVFKNPTGDYAARLIEAAELKGFKIGGAQVSEKHANFIINTGNATAADIEQLMAFVQAQVAQKYGISLQTEVCIVGEKLNAKQIERAEDFGTVAVLMGGNSAERDVSLRSGAAVHGALVARGVNALAVDVTDNIIDSLANLDVDRVFNIIHGRGGEDGVLQGVLDVLKLPYTGSGVLASALAMDKLRTKLCWRGANLPTPNWFVLKTEDDIDACIDALNFPIIVKPALEGSSVGMSKAKNRAELVIALETALACNCEVYAEAWVTGDEYTVGILQGQALPIIRLETPHEFYDYEAKYNSTTTQYHCPSGLNAEQEQQLQRLALQASDIISAEGWARVDVFIDQNGQSQLIEINTVPGMTDHSLVPMAAKQVGIDFNTLVWRILETSIRK